MGAPADTSSDGAHFPFRYFTDFLRFLKRHEEDIEVLTYEDLPWGADFAQELWFPDEWDRWQSDLASGRRDPMKIHVLLQHDADSVPDRTLAMLRAEERIGVPSNVMIFNKRVDRRHLEQTGEVRYADYELNPGMLQYLEREHGFVVGYHSNALERAKFDQDEARTIFEEDVRELRQHFQLRFFSPHGGVRGPNGENNSSIIVPESMRRTIRWVATGHSIKLDGVYSDGGLASTTVPPEKRDLRAFVQGWQRGQRYRILIHPQYYAESPVPIATLEQEDWYREVLENYESSSPRDLWENVSLSPLWKDALAPLKRKITRSAKGQLAAGRGRLGGIKRRIQRGWRQEM